MGKKTELEKMITEAKIIAFSDTKKLFEESDGKIVVKDITELGKFSRAVKKIKITHDYIAIEMHDKIKALQIYKELTDRKDAEWND